MLLWPPANAVPSARALLHDRRGGRSISVEGSPMWHLVVRLLPRLLPSVSLLRLHPPPRAAQGDCCLQLCPAAIAGRVQSSSEGKEMSEEN